MKTALQFDCELPALACRGCGATTHQTACAEERFLRTGQMLMLCGHCGLVYLTPDFTDAALNDFYEHHYRRVAIIDAAKLHDETFFRLRLNREFARLRVAQVVPQLPQNAKLLEIGSGYGAFLGQLHAVRPDVQLFATESDISHRERLLEGAAVTFLTHDEIAGAAPFDAIVALHVVEHLKRPREDARDYLAALNPSGKLYIEVPDILSPWDNWLYVQPAHVSYFGVASLRRTLLRAGAAIEYVGAHPAGAALGDTVWAVVSPRAVDAPRPEIPPASAEEIHALAAHIARYYWARKQALRMRVRNTLIALIGIERVGSISRHREYRANKHFFE